MLTYPLRDTKLALAEGLREYYASREELVGGNTISEEAQEFFRCHDVAHVVFGCTTTLQNEAIVKIWSLFGTTAGFRELRGYRLAESQQIYAPLPWRDIASTALGSVTVVPLVIWRCLRMHKRWPWSDFERYRDTPLVEIRNEYGIDPLHR